MDETQANRVVWRHIQAIGTCMMVTHDGGLIRARPMRGLARPDENVIWFFTDRESQKQYEVSQTPHACLAYADVKGQIFVSVSGTVAIVDDQAEIDRMWTEGAEVYFPGGKTDPDVSLLKFVPEFAEYWDAPSSAIVLAIKFLQAKVSGERPELGSTGRTQLGSVQN